MWNKSRALLGSGKGERNPSTVTGGVRRSTLFISFVSVAGERKKK